MALVSYSDSEASDSEPETKPTKTPVVTTSSSSNPPPAAPAPTTGNFQAIVDRSNPRKIRVALPEIKPENNAADGTDDGPARKRARIGGGGGAFAGFNSFLPAPKRNNVNNNNNNNNKSAGTGPGAEKTTSGSSTVPARKVFSLKTGATPGFDREADAEMRRDYHQAQTQSSGNGETGSTVGDSTAQSMENVVKEEPKLKGNAMMFKPLSVARSTPKKIKKPKAMTPTTTSSVSGTEKNLPIQPPKKDQAISQTQPTATEPSPVPAPVPASQKPKISLFSLSADEDKTTTNTTAQPTTYEPLVYNTNPQIPPTGPQHEESESSSVPTRTMHELQIQTLDNIANDLNLSRAQRRQLFGRQPAASKSQVLTFDADKEYAANQALAHETDVAAAQHNPVRPIAPGKHTLQQLVNVASNQRDALEESFATGRRNKKEAGSKYGW